MDRRAPDRPRAFTLIELLIVVAIIAILAAIAIPNFLTAQVRAKVTRTRADHRTLALAIETYMVDHNAYPWYVDIELHPMRGLTPVSLTTPIGYLSSLPTEPFGPDVRNTLPYIDPAIFPNPFALYNLETRKQHESYRPGNWDLDGPRQRFQWLLVGVGPDKYASINEGSNFHGNAPEYFSGRTNALGASGWYDPTNGSVSDGDLLLFGPGGGYEFPGLFPGVF